MKKVSVNPKRIKSKISPECDGIEFDDSRRLRNALIALAAIDPGWIAWVDQHVPAKIGQVGLSGQPDLRIARMIVERQARKMLMKGYSFLNRGFIQGVIDSDLYFADNGDLKAYR